MTVRGRTAGRTAGEHSCNPEGSGAREPCRFLATQARGTYGRKGGADNIISGD